MTKNHGTRRNGGQRRADCQQPLDHPEPEHVKADGPSGGMEGWEPVVLVEDEPRGEAGCVADLVYIPEAQRDRRSPGWRWGPRGFCRFCRGPIIVPRGKVKSAALRNWKRLRRDSFDALGSDLTLYTLATWHPWCWSHASVLMKPHPAAIARRRGQRFYSCDGCGFPIEYAGSIGRGERRTSVPWITGTWFREWLKILGDYERMRAGGEVDHVIPLWAGGRHRLNNLQVLCRPCHREKTAREALLRSRAKRIAGGQHVQKGFEFEAGG